MGVCVFRDIKDYLFFVLAALFAVAFVFFLSFFLFLFFLLSLARVMEDTSRHPPPSQSLPTTYMIRGVLCS